MISSRNDCIFCLSTDTKPTTAAAFQALGYLAPWNGLTLIEMDTAKVYVFDRENMTWREL